MGPFPLRGERLNLKELKEILQILDEKEITEFELEEEGIKLRIRKAHPPSRDDGARGAVETPAALATLSAEPRTPREAPGGAATASATSAGGPAVRRAADEDPSLVLVKSPIVGTFYRSPDPSSPAFVSLGDRVRVGQVLCIIEAMKLMNEIEAEVEGEIATILHENGQPVQYGEPLFAIRTDR
jgi:acetyl-CoA carboxylase biotin carboxyl carrier protein